MVARNYLIFTCICGLFAATFASDYKSDQALRRIAFGSCNKDDKPQPLWKPITRFKPDLFIWLGDVIYGDTLKFPVRFLANSAEYIENKFKRQKHMPGYAELSGSTHVIGTWDDHDFGMNNAGRDWALKEQTRQMFLDFLDEPADSPLRGRDGVYGAYEFGVPEKKVKVILLDSRYNLEHMSAENADMLGETQWRWFEQELATNDAQVLLLGSGIQVLPPEKAIQEKWANYPASRRRLFELLERYNPPNLVILSGDVHYGEFLRVNCSEPGRRVLEVTSSGLTHSCRTQYKFLCDFILDHIDTSRYHFGAFARDLNYGTIEFDWDSPSPSMTITLRGADDIVWSSHRVSLDTGNTSGRYAGCYPADDENLPTWRRRPLQFWINIIHTTLAVGALVAVLVGVLLWRWMRADPQSTATTVDTKKRR